MPWLAVAERPDRGCRCRAIVIRLLVLGFFSAVGILMYSEAVKRVSALLVTTLVSLELLITMMFEATFLKQTFEWFMVHGTVLIIIGAVSIGRENKRLRLS